MAIDLDKSAAQVNLGDAAYVAMLKGLQANILKSHGRDHARLVVLKFTGAPAAVKSWIRTQVAPKVTSAAAQRQQSASSGVDGGLITGFFLSSAGYTKLGFDTDKFASKAFRKGMKVDGKKDPVVSTWEAPYRSEIHALVALADDNETKVANAASAISASLGGIGTVLATEEGRKLKTADGIVREHFGYADGISQPRFEGGGTTSTMPDPDWDDGAPLKLVLTLDPFAISSPDAMGSYFVFRKLGQNLKSFNDQVVGLATSLGTSPNLAGAMAIGRFKDGTPVINSDVATGKSDENGFDYEPEDEKFKCPVHAHIRKANPRGTTPLTSLDGEKMRRIVRRGIPYGKPDFALPDPNFRDPSQTAQRGLLFMCFQRNIEKQFVFIQRTWIDNPNFPAITKNTGDDPILGQDGNEAQRWPLKWGDEDAGRKDFNFESPVTLEGGEYFFAPSLPFLQAIA